MSQRTVGLMTTLLELHRVHEPAGVLPLLLEHTAAEYGHAAAACYLLDARTGSFRLEHLADTEDVLSKARWTDELGAPEEIPHALAVPVLSQLATADPVTLTGPLATLLAGLWPSAVAEKTQRILGVRFASIAPIWMAQGPIGVVVLLLQDPWPLTVAAECAAHSAAALARLLERRSALNADTTPLMRDVVEQIAAREINRADRYGRVFSVAVFEPADATHPDGPQLELAALAAHVMRQPDTVGHLDQRRVIVLLPETPADGAAVFQRRLHRAAPDGLLPLSAGHATFPADGATLAELVSAAGERRSLLESLPEAERSARAPDAGFDTRRKVAATAATAVAEAEADGPTVRLRVAPLTDADLTQWKALLERLPAVRSVEPSGFDGFAGLFDVRAPTVTRLLTELQKLARTIGAELTPTITGEIGLTLRAEDASPRSRAASDKFRDFTSGMAAGRERERQTRQQDMPRSGAQRRGRTLGMGLAGVAAAAVAIVAVIGLRPGQTRGTPAPANDGQPTSVNAPAGQASDPAQPRVDRRISRDLSGGCLPPPGQAACDALRSALWAGDAKAWRDWSALAGENPAPAEIAAKATAMRLAAYDPATRVEGAKAAGKPLPLITGVGIQEEGGVRRIVLLELANLGAAPADLGGIALPGGLGRIPAGAVLPPGGRCAYGPATGDNGCAIATPGPAPTTVASGDRLQLVGPAGALLDDYAMP